MIRLLIIIIIGVLTVFSLIQYNNLKYGEVHSLVENAEISRTGYSFIKDDEELRFDASEDLICIKIDGSNFMVDRLELNTILHAYTSRRRRGKADTYSSDNYSVEVSISDETGPKHLLLGENYTIWYESSGSKQYDIINGHELIVELEELAEAGIKLEL